MRINEIQQALREEGLDGWLFFDHHGRDPLAYRILGISPGRVVTRRWYYLIPATGEPQALVHRIEPEVLGGLPGRTTRYSSWDTQRQGLSGMVKGLKRLAMQYSPDCAIPYVSMVDGGTLELVRSCGAEIVTSANLVQYFEARWNQHSLDTHLEAGRRVDAIREAAFAYIGEQLASGRTVTEFDVKQFILSRFAEQGLFTDHGPIVGINANASNPHYEPSAERNAPIRKNDLVLIDLWAKLDGDPEAVYYDITWTGFCGSGTPEKIEEVFRVVTGARDAAVKRVQDGVASKAPLQGFEVDDAARRHIARHGYADYFVHRTGHSIGTEVHGAGANMDNLETHDERRVIPWTCFSIEPGVYLPEFGIRSEVNVFVGDAEARVTGEVQRALVRI
jgi:Xaa-Pro aminopeptidase